MTTQNTRARIARISVLVIIVVALLAAGVSSVVVTLWVLLVGVALLVMQWLVLSVFDGAGQNSPARSARLMALAIIGVALLAAGVSSVVTLWSSSFARFMYLEDLGMTQAAEITRYTPVDRGLFIFGAILAALGAAALIAIAMLARHRWRAVR